MPQPSLRTLQLSGGLAMQVAVQGRGPLVLLCHGFPESWRSWRAQLAALDSAGYCAVAPDMRGYGGTDAPASPAHYTQLHHVGDMVDVVRQLNGTNGPGDGSRPVIVGHDWGAPVAWHAALLRPDLFRGVVGMSVPWVPPAHTDLLSALAKAGVSNFYMQHFQQPGVAEAELEADAPASVRRITFSLSGDSPVRGAAGILQPGAGFLDRTVEPPEPWPAWMDKGDIAAVGADFASTGFRGGLNWYRAIRLTHELLAPWRGSAVQPPALFIVGDRDDVLGFAGMAERVADLPRVLPGLRGSHTFQGAGHWIQRERAAEVNALLLNFLQGL